MHAAAGTSARQEVQVRTAARLHLGFLDPSGTLGRSFGSVGVVIEGFGTSVTLASAPRDRFEAATPSAQAELARVQAHVERLRDATGLRTPLHLHLQDVLPAHGGFGSGTQLALAVGRAFARCHGLNPATAMVAQWLGRGLRSGIGIAAFDRGGLLVDGGPGRAGQPAPLLAHAPLPAPWRVVVATEPGRRGLEGTAEREAIAALPPLPRAQAADLCHQVLMRVLPGAQQGDFAAFAAGLQAMQDVLGGHFAPAQGGSAWTSAAVGGLMARLRGLGRTAVGQSSWGPTGFAFYPTEDAARAALAAAGPADPELDIRIVAARATGAAVTP